jgi:hypothetical protein
MSQLFAKNAQWLVEAACDSGILNSLKSRVTKLERALFYPACLRQLLVLAAAKVNLITGDKYGSGSIPERRSTAPEWMKECLSVDGVQLQKCDPECATSPGSVRGDGNAAVHELTMEDQEAAVRYHPNEQMRQSLARIFKFVHDVEVDGI